MHESSYNYNNRKIVNIFRPCYKLFSLHDVHTYLQPTIPVAWLLITSVHEERIHELPYRGKPKQTEPQKDKNHGKTLLMGLLA